MIRPEFFLLMLISTAVYKNNIVLPKHFDNYDANWEIYMGSLDYLFYTVWKERWLIENKRDTSSSNRFYQKKKHQILALKVFACHIVQPLIDASIQGLFMKGMPSYCMVIEERVSKIEVEILAPAPKIA